MDNHVHMETISIKPRNLAVGSYLLMPTGEATPDIARVEKVELVQGAWRITTPGGAFVVPDGEFVQVVA